MHSWCEVSNTIYVELRFCRFGLGKKRFSSHLTLIHRTALDSFNLKPLLEYSLLKWGGSDVMLASLFS